MKILNISDNYSGFDFDFDDDLKIHFLINLSTLNTIYKVNKTTTNTNAITSNKKY